MRQGNGRNDYPSEVVIERELIVCTLQANGPFAITAGAQLPISFDTEDSDIEGMHNPAVNPDRCTLTTVPADATGIAISGWIVWDAGSGVRELHITENGATTGFYVASLARAFEIEQTIDLPFTRTIPVGKYFGLIAFSSANTNLLEARFELKFIFT